jgi:integrase
MPSQPFFWRAKNGWYLWTRVDGKRKRIFLAKSKKDAWDAWKLLTASGDPTFASVAARWLRRQITRQKRGEVSRAWLLRVGRTIMAFDRANPRIKCSAITPQIATAWLGDCSTSYEHSEVSTLKRILAWAVEEQMLGKSGLTSMRLSKGQNRKAMLSLDDHRRLVSETKDGQFRALLWFAWWTGCRPSELRTLRWEHLKPDCDMAVMQEHKNAKTTGKPRLIFFPPNAAAILRRHRRKAGWVFVNTRGRPWTKDAVVCRMKRLRERTGLDGTAYAYRHSFATRALEQGLGPADVAELLGTSIEIISRNYAHLGDDQRRLAELAKRVK